MIYVGIFVALVVGFGAGFVCCALVGTDDDRKWHRLRYRTIPTDKS